MCAETINETINVCKYVGSARKSSNVEGDVILQDIKPDILSIVRVTRDLCVTQKKVEDGKIKLTGYIDVSIIYVADDNTNSQKGVNSKIDFSEVLEIPGVNEDSIIRFRYEVANIEYKVVNGRKVLVSVPVTFEARAFNNCDVSIIKGITGENDLEMLKTTHNMCSPISQNSTSIELNEQVKLGENNPPIGEILCCTFNIINKEYKLSYNKILAKADALIKICYIADNERQSVHSFEATLPIMGFIDVNGINENSNISIDYEVKEYCIKPVYQDMIANSISVEAMVNITSFSFNMNEVELITDFYTPSAVIKTENQNMSVVKNVMDVEENINLSQTLVVPELDNTTILGIDGVPNITEKNILNDKVAIQGNVDVYVLFIKNDSRMIESKKIELPFQQVIKVDGINTNMNPIINLKLDNIEYKQNGENQLQVDIRMIASVMGDEESEINTITNLEITDEIVPTQPSLIIYYVKAGDTLWNIAKRFNNTVCNIKEANGLKDDLIYPGQRLIIPRLSNNKTSKVLM